LFTDSVEHCLESIEETVATCNFSQLVENCNKEKNNSETDLLLSDGVNSARIQTKDLVAIVEISVTNKTFANATAQIIEEKSEKSKKVSPIRADVIAIIGTTTPNQEKQTSTITDQVSHFINLIGFFTISALMGFVLSLL
jgi:hypothetical protein